MSKKIIMVSSWFNIEDKYENMANAKIAAERLKKSDRYKDVEIIELTESKRKIV